MVHCSPFVVSFKKRYPWVQLAGHAGMHWAPTVCLRAWTWYCFQFYLVKRNFSSLSVRLISVTVRRFSMERPKVTKICLTTFLKEKWNRKESYNICMFQYLANSCKGNPFICNLRGTKNHRNVKQLLESSSFLSKVTSRLENMDVCWSDTASVSSYVCRN